MIGKSAISEPCVIDLEISSDRTTHHVVNGTKNKKKQQLLALEKFFLKDFFQSYGCFYTFLPNCDYFIQRELSNK